jgi:peptidoglycan/xylan/chitin deacetylase (PgdA/CDA1 family)
LSAVLLDRWKRSADWFAGAFLTRGLVLVYHRVADQVVDPWNLAISPRHFAEHLDILRRSFRPAPLDDLVRRARAGTLRAREVAVTFDDGYADNLRAAKPLLERYGIPATVFITTGALSDPTTLWWDALQRLLIQPEQLPRQLDLEIAGRRRTWVLGEASYFSGAAAQNAGAWRGLQPPPHPRLGLYQQLWESLRKMSPAERRSAIDHLAAWSGRRHEPDDGDRPLAWSEVEKLVEGNLITVGAHSVTHVRLADLPLHLQESEIRESRATLEEMTGRPVTAFAYPHGGPEDYGQESVRLVQEAGFQCACAAYSGLLGPHTDFFQIPRLYMEDWDGDTFARLLRSRFGMRTE